MNQMLPNAWPIQKRLCKRHARKMKERERDGRNEKGMKGRGEEATAKTHRARQFDISVRFCYRIELPDTSNTRNSLRL